MADISNEFIKDSFDYVLQSDLSTGVVYRLGGEVPINPIFQSGLTINNVFTYSDGSEYNGFVLTSDANGNASWKPVSGTSSGFDTYVTGGTYSDGVITFTNNSGNTFTVTGLYSGYTDNGQYLFLSGGTLTGTLYGTSISATTISGGTFYGNGSGITGLTQQQINAALGYTPYNSTNPNGYITGYTDTYITGGTYSNGTATFTNNTGGTFNVSGFTTPFTGGIVTGLTATTISGGTISANAFSATTSITSVNVRVTGSMALGANGTIGNGIDIEDSISGKDNYKVRLRNNDSTSDCRFQVVNDSGGHCNLLKMGSTATSQYTYFTTHDAGLYNSSTAGNIVLYNSFTSGKVNVIAVSAGVQLPSNGTSWNTLSDERDKINLSPITDALDKVNTLRTVTGRYKEDIEGTSRAFLIAQDVEKVLPEAVWKDDDEKETLRLSYTEVIPLLIASIKELTEKNNNLETRLKSLENKTP